MQYDLLIAIIQHLIGITLEYAVDYLHNKLDNCVPFGHHDRLRLFARLARRQHHKGDILRRDLNLIFFFAIVYEDDGSDTRKVNKKYDIVRQVVK